MAFVFGGGHKLKNSPKIDSLIINSPTVNFPSTAEILPIPVMFFPLHQVNILPIPNTPYVFELFDIYCLVFLFFLFDLVNQNW